MKLTHGIQPKGALLFVAPLTDAVLLLLAFFLLSSGLVHRSGISVELPASSSRLPSLAQASILTITAESPPRLFLDGQSLAPHQLSRALEDQSVTSRSLIIYADQNASHGNVMAAANTALSLGFDIAFATRDLRAP